MSGPPMKLMVDPEAKPVAHHNPILVPTHWLEEVKAGLDQDVQLGVIEPVPVGTPVTWCHHMGVCPKKIRHTVAHNRTPSPKPARNQGDTPHTITISSGFDQVIANITEKIKIIDDTLIWSDDIDSSFFQAVEWLETCDKHGIILKPEKFVFAKESVMFTGCEITPTTVGPCLQSIKAIRDFPTPKNLTDISSWFGLVNQVLYAFASAEKMSPFHKLLKPGSRFVWTEELDRLFEETKDLIINEICKGAEIFDKNSSTCLATTDWSKDGVGFWLFQKHCKCKSSKPFCCRQGWKITLVGHRFTSGAESWLSNLKEKTLRNRFHIVHVPGIRHIAADVISRHPVGEPTSLDPLDDVAAVSDPLSKINPHCPQPSTQLFALKKEYHVDQVGHMGRSPPGNYK
ncbi:retroelement polyprotein [Plakobranchus ocellatus]|uniref:Retroelement polyprotein n=1 Tax=Plakobranchus ocellatus TaxID=259542 RepID=A0AAV3YZ35_9GAST|nr:retroelement polyprotein [Plakobranchus ocellatus]